MHSDFPTNGREQTIDNFSWLWLQRAFLFSHFYIPTMTAGAPNELMAIVRQTCLETHTSKEVK